MCNNECVFEGKCEHNEECYDDIYFSSEQMKKVVAKWLADKRTKTILEEIKAKERCRAIDDFAEMLKNRIDANMKQVLKHGLDLDMANLDKSDIDEVAKDIKGVNE